MVLSSGNWFAKSLLNWLSRISYNQVLSWRKPGRMSRLSLEDETLLHSFTAKLFNCFFFASIRGSSTISDGITSRKYCCVVELHKPNRSLLTTSYLLLERSFSDSLNCFSSAKSSKWSATRNSWSMRWEKYERCFGIPANNFRSILRDMLVVKNVVAFWTLILAFCRSFSSK